MKIVLDDVASGYQLSKINANFQKIEDELNNKVLYKLPPEGEANALEQDMDVNGKKLYNLPTPVLNSQAATKGYVDNLAIDASDVVSSMFLQTENNLSDLNDASLARAALELGTASLEDSSSFATAGHVHTGVYEPADATILKEADIGINVQAYDVDTAKTDVAQNFTASQRSAPIPDNDLSFDLSGAGNNYTCTFTGAGTLTFTNIGSNSGKSGWIKFVQSGTGTVSKASTTQITTANLTKLGTAGTYISSYYCDGTDVYVSIGVYA